MYFNTLAEPAPDVYKTLMAEAWADTVPVTDLPVEGANKIKLLWHLLSHKTCGNHNSIVLSTPHRFHIQPRFEELSKNKVHLRAHTDLTFHKLYVQRTSNKSEVCQHSEPAHQAESGQSAFHVVEQTLQISPYACQQDHEEGECLKQVLTPLPSKTFIYHCKAALQLCLLKLNLNRL